MEKADDPLEGIHSILSEMEREIRHTGIDPQQDAMMASAHLPSSDGGASLEPRIGGLTIEEFIHFLALLERVKEQHIDTKESGDDPAPGSGATTPSAAAANVERTSPYDNIIRSLGPDHPLYCNVATSPRISPPSDEEQSRSSASSSPCSSDEDAGQFQLPDKSNGLPGFSFLERLFLRRYLHVIPEEVASDCGSHSARLSRALSGLSSALSYLEDVDDDRFSHESIGDEYPDFASAGSLTPVPTATSNNDVNLTVPLQVENEALECIQQSDDLKVEKSQDTKTESSVDVTERRIPSDDEFSIVLAVPVMIVDSSDYDDPADSPTEEDRTSPFISTDDGLPTRLPQVLDEMMNDPSVDKGNDDDDEKTEEEIQSEVTSLADYCELLDESSLPLSVLMMQTSGCCCRDDEETGQRTHSERNDPSTTEDYACSCSLGFSDDDEDGDNNDNMNVNDDDNNEQPVIIDPADEMATLTQVDGLTGMTTTAFEIKEEERTSNDIDVGDTLTKVIHLPTVETSSATGETTTTTSGTSVVTLIDAKIVSVDYKPVQEEQEQLIRSSAQLRHGTRTAETLDKFQQQEPAAAENRQLAGENPAQLETDKKTGQVSNEETNLVAPALFTTHNSNPTAELTINKAESIPVDHHGVCSSTTKKHGRVVDEMRRLWETRCAADPSVPSIASNNDKDASIEYGSDQSTPVPEEETAVAVVEPSVNDSVRMKSIQEFRMLWSGWPPPPPLPPPPEHYGASETETGYSTDGSEPFRQRRRRAALMSSSIPTPPPRPTPPRDDHLYRSRSDHSSGWHDRPPEPPLRYQPAYRFQPLCYYSAPEADEEDDDERVKARLLADWLVLANRKRSHSPSSGTYRSFQRSNYSTLTSTTTTTTRETSARESESEASDYNDRTDCHSTIRRYRRHHHQRDDEYLSQGESPVGRALK